MLHSSVLKLELECSLEKSVDFEREYTGFTSQKREFFYEYLFGQSVSITRDSHLFLP
jgi:hypothetical protein